MIKFIFLTACLIIALSDSSLSANIDCEYVLNDYIVFGSRYYCNVWTVDISTPEAAQITSAKGIHKDKRTNDDVVGFHARRKAIKYFPQNLLSVFKNLQRININGCKLEEIHQSDLKAHPNLTHFYLTENLIEVVEEGLFDFNPNLVWVGINEAKLIHIDAHVFDHLTGLISFWFTQVPCIKKTADNSREKVEAAIYIAKAACVNLEFRQLDSKIDKLESDSKTLSAEDFKASLESFEKGFVDSRFSKFRPLNYKFAKLKGQNGGSNMVIGQTTKKPELSCDKVTENLNSVQTGTDQLTNGLTSITSKLNSLQDTCKSSQSSITLSITKLTTNFNEFKTKYELSSDDIRSTMSDMDTALSSIKTSQNDLKTVINKLKTSQNEISISVNELKNSKNGDFEDKFVVLSRDIGSLKEQMEAFMSKFTYFEVENAVKFEKIEKELVVTRHKIDIGLDEKIKGIEKRLARKFEDILEEKLAKILSGKS
ncbi:hypothetical protein ACKWTF_015122 [Chironomus riparius]